MKTFTTSIFVPSKSKKELTLLKTEELSQRLNKLRFSQGTTFWGRGVRRDPRE